MATQTQSTTESKPAAVPESARPVNYTFWAMLVILALMAVGLFAWTASHGNVKFGLASHKPLPVLGTVPDFSLTERDGTIVTDDMLRGRVWVADFIFTSCAGTCPTMSENMSSLARALERVPELIPPAALVSFTVDPKNDTPEVLQEYAKLYDAKDQQWLFLTGEYKELQDIATKGFKIGVQEGYESELEPIIHGQSFVLVDKKGQIRGYYDGTEDQVMRNVLADIQKIIRER